MAFAAYASSLKISGTAVVITNEACTGLGGSQWQVTTAARRIIDPATAVVVKDTGVTVSAALYSVNMLFGIITFSGYTPTGAVTLTGAYLPLLTVAEVRSADVSMETDMADSTTFDNAGYKGKTPTLDDWSGSFEFLSLPTVDLDGVAAGTQSITSWRESGTPKLLELKLSATPHYWRGWGVFDAGSMKLGVGDLAVFTASMKGASQGSGTGWAIGT